MTVLVDVSGICELNFGLFMFVWVAVHVCVSPVPVGLPLVARGREGGREREPVFQRLRGLVVVARWALARAQGGRLIERCK